MYALLKAGHKQLDFLCGRCQPMVYIADIGNTFLLNAIISVKTGLKTLLETNSLNYHIIYNLILYSTQGNTYFYSKLMLKKISFFINIKI